MTHSALVKLPPHVTPDLLDVTFWLDRVDRPDADLLSPAAAADFNARVSDKLGIPHVFDLPDRLSVAEVQQALALYPPPTAATYGPGGQLLDAAYYDRLRANAPAPKKPVTLRWGLVTRRTDVRSFPTADVITSAPYDFAYDRVQETTVDVGWPVAVLTTSRDGRWYFGLTPLYWGWVRVEHVALGTRDAAAGYVRADPFVVITAARALVSLAADGGATPQMGTRLPLEEHTDRAYRLKVPVRTAEGTLSFTEGFATSDADQFHVGYLPCTLRTVLGQAFRLLGEPYAWGGSRLGIFGRDCSRFIQDVYAVTGVHLPRNAHQQGHVCAAQASFTPEMTGMARKLLLATQVSPGAILVMPGHVMLYLGHIDGEPYAIHDTGVREYSGVIVSDLSLGADTPAGSLLQRLTQAVAPG